MARLIRLPAIKVLLVVASLHQLGACPCACLEHHGWSHWIARALSLTPTGAVAEESGATAEEAECEHTPRDAAILAARVVADDALSLGYSHVAKATNPAATLTHAIAAIGGAIPNSAAPPVRALLQVFRL